MDDATLPVIDLGGVFSGDPANKARIVAELGRSARSSGFCYITGHGVLQSLIDAVMAASRQFHGMLRSYRMSWWSSFATHHRGSVPFEEDGSNFPKSINMNEAQDMSNEAPAGHPDWLAKWRMTGPNNGPICPVGRTRLQALTMLSTALASGCRTRQHWNPASKRKT